MKKMKKMFKRVFALVLASILLTAPSVASAASSPVLVADILGIRGYAFQPDPYALSAGRQLTLNDYENTDGYFHVPKGKQASYFVHVIEPVSCNIKIYWPGHGYVAIKNFTDTVDLKIELPKITIDAKYEIIVTAYTDMDIYAFAQFLD